MIGEMQKSLYETKPLSDSNLFAVNKLVNLAVAFGVTKTGLKKMPPWILKCMFYGMHNLKIPLEKMIIENPAEILSEYFATGILKKGNQHFNNFNIPNDFFKLVKYLNSYSYENGFASFAHEFKKYFSNRPWEQVKRHGLLRPNIRDRYVGSFFTLYNLSSREKEFDYGFYDKGDKEFHVDKIYEELTRSSDKANFLFSLSSNNSEQRREKGMRTSSLKELG